MKIFGAIIGLLILGFLMSLFDGACGYWLLDNRFHLGYWVWYRIALFGTIIVGSGVGGARLRD